MMRNGGQITHINLTTLCFILGRNRKYLERFFITIMLQLLIRHIIVQRSRKKHNGDKHMNDDNKTVNYMESYATRRADSDKETVFLGTVNEESVSRAVFLAVFLGVIVARTSP